MIRTIFILSALFACGASAAENPTPTPTATPASTSAAPATPNFSAPAPASAAVTVPVPAPVVVASPQTLLKNAVNQVTIQIGLTRLALAGTDDASLIAHLGQLKLTEGAIYSYSEVSESGVALKNLPQNLESALEKMQGHQHAIELILGTTKRDPKAIEFELSLVEAQLDEISRLLL